jgi:hypothetical protein
MHHIPRTAGIGLLVYGLGTAVAFMGSGAPGGGYQDAAVGSYIASTHWVTAFSLWYVGALGALGLVLLGSGLRGLRGVGDLLWGLCLAAAATSVTGAFVSGGVDVAMAEGGSAVGSGVPHAVVYTLTEIGNLLAVCSPALFVGVGAILLAARGHLPGWVRVVTVVAGACGVLAPFFFTYFVYLLWVVAAGIALTASRQRHPETTVQASLV